MSQNLNLSIAGINNSASDLNGLPPGSLDVGDNIEIRYKNVASPRRGFDELPDSEMTGKHFRKMSNFYISGTDRTIALTSDDDLVYYTGANPWPAVPGDYSSNILNPDDTNGKSKFIHAGSNLYVTARDGVRSLCSGSGSEMIRAGVPKGLNLEAETNGDVDGFLSSNIVLSTTCNTTSGSDIISTISDTTGIAVGQYVATDPSVFPSGTVVDSISLASTVLITTGTATIGNHTLSSVGSTTGLSVGNGISGNGIPDDTVISALPGSSNITMSNLAIQTTSGATYTFTTNTITLSENASASATGSDITFYSGSQVGYRILFGRVETDINSTSVTRLGAPSTSTIVTNILSAATNVTVTATLPKNSDNEISFVQLYRSAQTDGSSISPLDQYSLVYEAELTASDFTNRVLTITDDVPDSLVGIPLYCGSDQEGILQANNPPPMCWDIARFRDFTLFGNITQPTTAQFTIISVGSPSGIQTGDTIHVTGSFVGTSFGQIYTASGYESQALRIFQAASGGTSSQNIADTANSLIRVINYDNALPVHAILLSGATDLPGQIELEADYPSLDTFTTWASAHTTAYDPTLTDLVSDINTVNNGVSISKSGELEAVPATNLLNVGDSSSAVLRLIPLRDYVFVVKTDGIYKIQGTSPSVVVVNPFDLTTKIIGAETAVSLNAGMWMMSNQGVVSVSDGGVELKSLPIDNELNTLIDNYLDNLTDVAFAIGYESDRKYILCVPSSDNAFAQVEYNFNYTTNAWTTWSRDFYAGFINDIENKLYVARADSSTAVSKERKAGTYQDFVDEGVDNTITSVSTVTIGLNDVSDVTAGDILYQDSTHFSPILDVDLENSTVTVQYELSFTTGACSILAAYLCEIEWKQVFGDNPAFVRQFSEGLALFKNTRFNVATARFQTDFSQTPSDVTLTGTGDTLWGLFGWGEQPWGGSIIPSNIRFYIPQDKQLGSYLLPAIRIQQGFSDFKLMGLSISYYNISQEVGL